MFRPRQRQLKCSRKDCSVLLDDCVPGDVVRAGIPPDIDRISTFCSMACFLEIRTRLFGPFPENEREPEDYRVFVNDYYPGAEED